MNNNKELLELAAAAVGYEWQWFGATFHIRSPNNPKHFIEWAPLDDDGDALRLAVTLGIKVTPYPIYEQPKHSVLADRLALSPEGTMGPQVIEIYNDDPMAATRRAIVRAAAEIGSTNDH